MDIKFPIAISGFVLALSIFVTAWIGSLGVENYQEWTLVISVWTVAGALVSAVFALSAYWLNLGAFIESNKPRIYLRVGNGEKRLITTGKMAHTTEIHYSHQGGIECDELLLGARLLCEGQRYELNGLFESACSLQVGESRCRDFPTRVGLPEFGVPQEAVNNLSQCKLQVSYKMQYRGKPIERHLDYKWYSATGTWGIA